MCCTVRQILAHPIVVYYGVFHVQLNQCTHNTRMPLGPIQECSFHSVSLFSDDSFSHDGIKICNLLGLFRGGQDEPQTLNWLLIDEDSRCQPQQDSVIARSLDPIYCYWQFNWTLLYSRNIHISYYGWGWTREFQRCLSFSGSASAKVFCVCTSWIKQYPVKLPVTIVNYGLYLLTDGPRWLLRNTHSLSTYNLSLSQPQEQCVLHNDHSGLQLTSMIRENYKTQNTTQNFQQQ